MNTTSFVRGIEFKGYNKERCSVHACATKLRSQIGITS